jgi:GAF domain-containing protein
MVQDDQLQLLYELSRRLATFTDLEGLLRYTTRRVRELLEADGCAVLLHDRARAEFYFPVSSQAESSRAAEAELAEIRFPAERGIAGAVLAAGKPVLVDDVTKDHRFYPEVDRITGDSTRTLLCAPLRTAAGAIGVIEVVNPAPRFLTPAALEFLDGIASDVAVAYEKARLYDELRTEVVDLRRVCRFAGWGLMLLGVIVVSAAVTAHLAWALPLEELLLRPGLWSGLVPLLAGAGLVLIARPRRLAVVGTVP